jgi:hypothetical protein
MTGDGAFDEAAQWIELTSPYIALSELERRQGLIGGNREETL